MKLRVDQEMIDHQPPQYVSDVSHYFSSSSQVSTCSVEPGSPEDVSKIVRYSLLVLLSTSADVMSSLVGCSGNNPHAIRDQGWRVCYESGIFFDKGRANCNDALQRDQG